MKKNFTLHEIDNGWIVATVYDREVKMPCHCHDDPKCVEAKMGKEQEVISEKYYQIWGEVVQALAKEYED